LFIFSNTFVGQAIEGLKTGVFTNEVAKKKKVYFFDLGLVNWLGEDFAVDKGKIVENFVFSQIMPYLPNYLEVFYWKKR